MRPAHVHEAWPDIDERWESFPHEYMGPVLLDHFVQDWRDVLPRIEIPTWIVATRFSPISEIEAMEWMAAEVQDGYVTVFEQSGHYPMMNEPEAFNRELLQFLAS